VQRRAIRLFSPESLATTGGAWLESGQRGVKSSTAWIKREDFRPPFRLVEQSAREVRGKKASSAFWWSHLSARGLAIKLVSLQPDLMTSRAAQERPKQAAKYGRFHARTNL
jgi:hypothetical protein